MPLASGAAFLSPGNRFRHASIAAATRLTPPQPNDYQARVDSAHRLLSGQGSTKRKSRRATTPLRPPSLPLPDQIPTYSRPVSRASSALELFAPMLSKQPLRATTAPTSAPEASWNHKLVNRLHPLSRPKTTPSKFSAAAASIACLSVCLRDCWMPDGMSLWLLHAFQSCAECAHLTGHCCCCCCMWCECSACGVSAWCGAAKNSMWGESGASPNR